MYDETVHEGLAPPRINIFSQIRFGLPIAMMGIVFMSVFGPHLLPGGHKINDSTLPTSDFFLADMLVDSPRKVIVLIMGNNIYRMKVSQ